MSWFKIVRHDLHCGLLRWRYLAAVILAMIPCLEFQYALTARELSGNWIDFLLNTFRGVAPIQNTVAMNEVQIPFVWLTIMGACLYLNLDYMLYDLTTNGQQVIIRSGTRSGWFLSKCLWNLFATVCYFGLIALAECMFVLAIGGELTAKNTPEVSQMLFGMVTFSPVSLTALEGVLIGLVLPCLSAAALNMLQMVLCLLVKPVVSYLVCVALLVLSIYWNAPFDLGSGAMAMRSAMVAEGGHGPGVMIAVLLSVIAGCAAVGCLVFKHTDILNKEH